MMKITGIQFSFAKEKTYPGDTIGFFSVQFDGSMIIHRFTLKRAAIGTYTDVESLPGYKVATNGKPDYRNIECPAPTREEVRLVLPRLGIKPPKHTREKSIIFVSDKELLNELRDKSYEVYKYLIDNYNGIYTHKENGSYELPDGFLD